LRGALLFTLLVTLAVLIVLLAADYFRVDEVRVPDVVGSDLGEARRALTALGFEVSTFTEEAPAAPAGSVTSQTPEAGSVVRRGRGVSLGVSASPASAEVPGLVGRTQAEATQLLEAAELPLGSVRYRHAEAPEGTVLEQTPEVGTDADGVQRVSLTVSRGPRPERVVLPSVVGMRPERARARLAELGFRRVEAVPSRVGPPGVRAQVPRSGQRVSVSAPVTLYYALSNPQVVRVPEVTGLPLEEAARRLNAAGLRVGWVSEESFDLTKPRGVTEVTPEDHTLWGAPVALRVNGEAGAWRPQEPAQLPPPRLGNVSGERARPGARTGAPEPTGGRQVPINFDPSNYGYIRDRAYEFRIEVSDARGDRVVVNRAMGPNEPVRDRITVYGEAEVRMYIDGQIAWAYNP